MHPDHTALSCTNTCLTRLSLCSPAYGVELRDVAWQAGTLNVAVDAAPGAVTEARFATVPAGGNVSHTYGIVVKAR